MTQRILAFVMALGLLLAAPALAQGLQHVVTGQAAPDFRVRGADGRTHSLSAYRGKVVVLEWTSPACPYTKAKYDNGVMQGLQAKARRQGVVWLSVNSSHAGKPGYLTRAQANARVAATKATVTAFLLDDGGKLGRMYGARSTPQFFIIGKDGKLAYQGAIDDDSFARGEATKNYVELALNDLAANRPVGTAETRPYGCPVEY